MKAVVKWTLAAALVAAAWGITLIAPSEDAGRDTFATEMTLGERAEGRNMAATVLDVRSASRIRAQDGWQADGTWLVVEVSAEAVVDQQSGTLGAATLRIGDRTFSASERGPDSATLYRTRLVPGVPQTGSLLFEVPEDALHGTATLRLSTWFRSWGDSLLQLQIDLDDVEHVDTITVEDTGWTNQ